MFYSDGLRSIHIFIHEFFSIKKKQPGNTLKKVKNHTNVLFHYTILANKISIANNVIYMLSNYLLLTSSPFKNCIGVLFLKWVA